MASYKLAPGDRATSVDSGPLFVVMTRSVIVFTPVSRFKYFGTSFAMAFSDSYTILPGGKPPRTIEVVFFGTLLRNFP